LLPLKSATKTTKNTANSKKQTIGENNNGRVSAYLRGELLEVKEVQSRLEKDGFEIISISKVDKKGSLTTIIYTNDKLKTLADKKNRAFLGSLRVLIDKQNKQTSISNPLYFSKAYMQDDHDEKVIKSILDKLVKSFPNLKNSKDNLKYTLLPKYQFMNSMPYFSDFIKIGKASSSEKLLAKAKSSKSAKDIVYTQVLSKDRIILGVRLGKRTSRFISKIGSHNASLLPYPILIENGIAKILDPKYYIAISYPMLKMSQFMKISTVPGAIQNDCEKFFK
jgi:hypothetical protein